VDEIYLGEYGIYPGDLKSIFFESSKVNASECINDIVACCSVSYFYCDSDYYFKFNKSPHYSSPTCEPLGTRAFEWVIPHIDQIYGCLLILKQIEYVKELIKLISADDINKETSDIIKSNGKSVSGASIEKKSIKRIREETLYAEDYACFCSLINEAKIMIMREPGGAVLFCQEVCNAYNINYTERISKAYYRTFSKTTAEKVTRNLVLALIENKYQQTLQRLYV
jgi:hypothetical protein